MRKAALFVIWCALWLVYGCATARQFRPREGQEQAVHVVWVEVYGRTERPPLIRWVTGDDLNCIDKSNDRPGFKTPIGCRQGFTWSPLEVSVALVGDELSLAETTLGHELLHAAQAHDLIFDPHHGRPEWLPGGLVDQGNEAIIKAGR